MNTDQERINGFHTWALMGTAVFIDFLQAFLTFIPFIGPVLASILTIIARIAFWVWFRLLGVGFADKSSRFMINVSVTVIEMLPLINFIPSWSIGTWMIIQQVKKEDAEANLRAANANKEVDEIKLTT